MFLKVFKKGENEFKLSVVERLYYLSIYKYFKMSKLKEIVKLI